MVSLSQVFLHNEQTLKRIADACRIKNDDTVFEIGGGKEQLTKYLLKSARKVYVCEIDKKLMPFLRELNAEIINKNFLQAVIPDDVTLIVGNIPYHLSGKITEKVLKHKVRSVIMYQKEFAERLNAQPGSRKYSRLSVLVQCLSVPKILFGINRHDFKPVPKVDSCLVEFTPTKNDYDKGFFDFVKILFQFKNKSVKNALVSGRRHWSKVQDKRELKDFISKFTDKKVVSLSIQELKEQHGLFAV